MKYTKQDKILMNAFVQAQKDIEHFYLQALREKNLQKAKYYAEKAKLIVQELQEEYQDWALTRGAEEYLKGFKQVEHLKRGTPQREQKLDTNKIFLQVGKVHKEAVLALVQSGNRAVFATLDGMKRDITYGLALFSSKGREIGLQHEIQSKLGAGLLTGKGLHYQKSDLVAFFQKKGLQLRDRSGRKWDPHTYAEMLIRTETARAYNAGMINRAIQLGTTKFRVVESWNCCDICAQYNGKIVDINQGSYDLPPYHPNCYHKDTQVMTDRGWKYFYELRGDEKCLSVNPETKETEYVSIKQIISHEEKELVHFKNDRFDLAVSCDHAMVYISDWHYHNDKKIEFAPAEEFLGRKARYIPKGINREGKDTWSDLFVRFMAMYISDGSTSILKNGKYRIKIAQDRRKSPEGYQRVVEVCEKLGYRAYHLEQGIELNYDQELGAYLHALGKCDTKYIPQEIKHASKRQIQIFLNEYLHFDGYTRTNNWKGFESRERKYFTTSKQLMSDLCELIAKAGGVASVKIQKPKTITFSNGTYTQNFDAYIIGHNTKCYADVRKMTVEKRAYNDLVWCVELERNHTLYVMYNGKICISGNCRGTITPVWEEDWRENHFPNEEIAKDFEWEIGKVNKKYSGSESPIGTVNEVVIKKYSNNDGYKTLNLNLRENLPLSERDSFIAKTLDRVITNNLDYKQVVYRGVDIDKNELKNIISSLTWREGGFTSTSKDEKVAKFFASQAENEKIILKIQHKGGMDIEKYSNYPDEKEVLLGKNKTFKITGIQKKADFTYLTLIENE